MISVYCIGRMWCWDLLIMFHLKKENVMFILSLILFLSTIHSTEPNIQILKENEQYLISFLLSMEKKNVSLHFLFVLFS